MNEIGSEFWTVETQERENNFFPPNIQWFLSGRSALKAVIKNLDNCKTVAMPSWCCDSMIKPFIDVGIEVKYYPVYWQDGLIEEISTDCDILFLIDYFGHTSDSVSLSGYKGVVVRDCTHSLFSGTSNDADYYFGSLRKWSGLWTGGYAWTRSDRMLSIDSSDDNGFALLRKEAMAKKKEYIKGEIHDKDYLFLFNKAEETLNDMGIVSAADRDVRIAQRIDVNGIRSQRRKNANVLMEAFPELLIFRDYNDQDCPMFVPILVPNAERDALRAYLTNNNIYCPVHWPISELHRLDSKEKSIYDNELSLVCDQRYTTNDMHRMVDVIMTFWK